MNNIEKVKKLTNEEIFSLSELYNSGLSSWAIGKKLNIDHKTALYHLKKLGVKRRDRSSAAKEGVKSGRIIIKKNYIPKNLSLNEDLAYIFGVLAGDGYMDYSNKRKAYNFGLSATDKEFVDKFRQIISNYFKINSSFEFQKSKNIKWKDKYITRLCSKEACDFINSFGYFKNYNWKIPNIIKNSNNKIKCAFIKGFFDSEGEIDKKIGRVGASSMNLGGLKEIGDLLFSLGIRYTIIKKKDNRPNTHQKYVLRIHDKESLKLFNKLIGFTIRRKQKILDEFFPNIIN